VGWEMKSEGTGFSLRIDLSRLAVYVLLGVASWLGHAPWWVLPAVMLYDNTWVVIYHSPKRLRELRRLHALFEAQSAYQQVLMPGTEVDQ
jgi:hypothetical protein